MKKIILLLGICLHLLANDILVFNNEYEVLELNKKVKKLIVGNKDMINVSLLDTSSKKSTLLKIFGKKTGNTSILIVYRDHSIENYHVYVNENLGFIQKMVNVIEPDIRLSKVGNGSTVIAGKFKDPHDKQRILDILQNGGVDLSKLMDLTETTKVNKMIRTKLYLVEINNQRAKDLGGVTGLGFFNKYLNLAVNPSALNAATFSGFLLDNTAQFTATTGNSIVSTLNFLEQQGIANILDDTVLMTTEDKNASFRVGGEVYIPIGLTQNVGFAPTIQVEEREYGLRLTLTSKFMETKGYMHINVNIKDSEFDTNKEHDVQLGKDIFVPSFVSKNMLTNVVVKSGQVIALGGRLHSEDTDKEDKVPFLGDIPVLGELFKHTVKGTKTSDLLFFLVPEIVDANENLDDTHFYKEFKDSSNLFHTQILDLNDTNTQEAVNESNNTTAKQSSELNITDTNTSVNETQKEDMPVIEVEDTATPNAVESVSDEIVLPKDEETITDSQTPNTIISSAKPAPIEAPAQAEVTKPSNENMSIEESVMQAQTVPEQKADETVEQPDENLSIEQSVMLTQPVPEQIEDEFEQPAQKYAVAVQRIFLRDKPANGTRVTVWTLGHEFTASQEKEIRGTTWLKVKENCYDTCKPVNKDLWISKKYVSEI